MGAVSYAYEYCYGKNAHSVGGADWRKKWPERWSNDYSFVLEATEFALISLFGQAAEIQGSSCILRGQREGAKIVLNRSIAGLFGSCNYMRTPETYCPHMAYYFSLPLLVISPRVSF